MIYFLTNNTISTSRAVCTKLYNKMPTVREIWHEIATRWPWGSVTCQIGRGVAGTDGFPTVIFAGRWMGKVGVGKPIKSVGCLKCCIYDITGVASWRGVGETKGTAVLFVPSRKIHLTPLNETLYECTQSTKSWCRRTREFPYLTTKFNADKFMSILCGSLFWLQLFTIWKSESKLFDC